MMKWVHRESEAGQIVVLLAVSFVILLGFTGLAIDGGMVYTDRRHAQNAADAASLAGAEAMLNGGDRFAVANARAADNGFNNDQVQNYVYVYNPPIDGPFAGNPFYIQVRIRSRVKPIFSHFVYGGILENTVTAVARAKPAVVAPLLDGHALVGLAPHGCSVVWSHGNNTTSIDGGSIFVNSDDPDCALIANGGNNLVVNGYGIYVVGGWEVGNNSSVTPIPTSGAQQVSTPVIAPPTCAGDAVWGAGTVSPGNVTGFDFNGGTWTLQPGIYCVDGGFRINGGMVIGNDVLIYVRTGDVTWSANATIVLDAANDGEYAGMLVYQDPANDERATINGNSSSYFTGTIYMPSAEIQVNGTGAADGFHSQLIGYKVDLSGTADTQILYDPSENYVNREPGRVELSE